jgi:hypothetical protein
MREAKSYRDPYTDVKRTSAMSGPHRRKKDNRITGMILAIAIGLLLALAAMAWATECTTDTECGCTDDCLEPAVKK